MLLLGAAPVILCLLVCCSAYQELTGGIWRSISKMYYPPRWAIFLSIGTLAGIVTVITVCVVTKDDITPQENLEQPSIESKTLAPQKQTKVTSANPKEEKALSDEVLTEIGGLLQYGRSAPRLFGMLEQIPMPSLFGFLSSTSQLIKDSTVCVTCRSVIDALLRYYESNKSPEGLRDLVKALCVKLQIQSEEVCNGVIDLNLDTIVYIINNTQNLTSSRICGVVLQPSGCSIDDPFLEWTVDADLGEKPSDSKKKKTKTAAGGEPLTIVQITDIHHDPTYTTSGNAECGEPMCCRRVQGDPSTPEAAAGYWGDYRKCDLAWQTFENAIQQIKTHKNIDYIYMTGDIVDHAVWDTSIEKNTDVIKKVLAYLKTEFGNIPVYPILGNHEPSPLNAYAPTNITEESISTNWLYELMAEEWTKWLPADTKETILQGGFYSVLAKPGFRIIGLNNNVCYTFNWWLLHDAKDPLGQLKWLAETLLKAEKAGEKVHILGHVPTGDDSCQRTWSREYRKIIDRFEDTVTAQFNGHTHYDELEVFYALDDPTRPNNVAYNGGSLTQYDNLNSNYKIYKADSGSFEILDAETWIFNLTSANLKDNATAPQWYKLYSYKEDFGMESLSPSDFDQLAHKMVSDKSILQKYARYFVKEADPSLNCDEECLKNKLCLFVTSQVGDKTMCDKLMQEFQSD